MAERKTETLKDEQRHRIHRDAELSPVMIAKEGIDPVVFFVEAEAEILRDGTCIRAI